MCDINNYEWAFGHEHTILEMAKHVEYTVDNVGVQTVPEYIVKLIQSEVKTKNSETSHKFGIGKLNNVNVNEPLPLVVCNTLEKCIEYTKTQINNLISQNKELGFELESEEELQNTLEDARYDVPVNMVKRDENGDIVEYHIYHFYFQPIDKYE